VLNPAVIEAYLKKQRENYEWLKGCSSAELDHHLWTAYGIEPGFLNLWDHQKVALLLLHELKRFMLFMDMGSGKTLTTLALIQSVPGTKAIVFVPYVTSVMTWVDECAKHTPILICQPLVSDTSSNFVTLCNKQADLYVICYQSAVAMFSIKEGKWRLDVDKVRETFSDFTMLVCDEAHKCKDINTLTYKLCRIIAGQSEFYLGLTGTPFGRDLQDLWPQFYLVDNGRTLGPTLSFYREVFFTLKKRRWGRRIAYEYSF